MCGRYTLTAGMGFLFERFQLNREDLDYHPRYNIAPTQRVLVVLDDGSEDGPHGEMVRWGLVPWFMKDPKKGPPMINARAETVATNGAFKGPLARQRCLVIASGFYEWHKGPGPKDKTPMLFQLASGEPFAFAGLWEEWTPKEGGEKVRTCTIITTTPNAVMEPIHDRMPVILPRELESVWLDGTIEDPAKLQPLLAPYEGDLEAYPVSVLVNAVKNDTPELILPAGV